MKEDLINSINNYSIFPKTIFDIGSRDLEESIFFKKIYPNAKVYAFEPNPEQELICSEKAKLNKINFYNLAMSDSVQKHDFYAIQKDGPNPNIGASALSYFSEDQLKFWKEVSPQSQPSTKKYEINTITLDYFCAQNSIDEIDILWMDVQGWEKQVLIGGLKMLSKIKLIYTELSFKEFYEKTSLYPDVKEFLEEHNFLEIWNQNKYSQEYKVFRNNMNIGLTETIFLNKNLL